MNMNNTNDLKETDTFKMLNNRMLYYRKVLGSTPTEQTLKQHQRIKNKYDRCVKIKKLLHRATRHLYDESNITPQTLIKEAKFRALKMIH